MAHPFVQAHVQPQPHVRLFDERGASRWAAARRDALPRVSQRASCMRACGATAETAGDALVAEALSVRLGAGNERVQALRQATLRVKRGTLHMLLGPNGCGKSTLLRVCGGLLRPDGGRLRVAAPRAFVFQNPDHQVVMPSAGADVAFGLGRLGLPPSEVATRVEAALTAVGLQGFALRPVHTLSGGQKQRVAIAGALAEQPQVLLLDELTTFLDADDQRSVLDAIRAAVDGPQRVTALWVTHRLEELDFADAASYMEGGTIVRTGTGVEMRRWAEKQSWASSAKEA